MGGYANPNWFGLDTSLATLYLRLLGGLLCFRVGCNVLGTRRVVVLASNMSQVRCWCEAWPNEVVRAYCIGFKIGPEGSEQGGKKGTTFRDLCCTDLARITPGMVEFVCPTLKTSTVDPMWCALLLSTTLPLMFESYEVRFDLVLFAHPTSFFSVRSPFRVEALWNYSISIAEWSLWGGSSPRRFDPRLIKVFPISIHLWFARSFACSAAVR